MPYIAFCSLTPSPTWHDDSEHVTVYKTEVQRVDIWIQLVKNATYHPICGQGYLRLWPSQCIDKHCHLLENLVFTAQPARLSTFQPTSFPSDSIFSEGSAVASKLNWGGTFMIFINAFIIFNMVQNHPKYSISVLYYLTYRLVSYIGTYKTQVRQQNNHKITVTCLWSLKHSCVCSTSYLGYLPIAVKKQHCYCK